MNDYEARRLEKIKHNQALLAELDIRPVTGTKASSQRSSSSTKPPPPKKRRIFQESAPSRVSARIAASTTKPSYNDDADLQPLLSTSKTRVAVGGAPKSKPVTSALASPFSSTSPETLPVKEEQDLSTLRSSWSSWTPSAPAPTRDDVTKQFHFDSHPTFTPNKSPEEMLREGVFGGGYFRPLKSRKLGLTVSGDWEELPEEWLRGLDVESQLLRESYEPEQNKFRVSCGQSIEEWEANGWIRHEFDVRGWFQWYVRFFRGRRCEDDERQVGRWERCVGPRGRWRRMLLKAYLKAGVRTVWDDGEDEDAIEVSPVMHQTCLHWAWEVRQDELDEVWERGGL